MNDICVFFGEGYEEIEALTVVDILRRASLPVKMVSITEKREVTGSHQITVKMDCILSEVDFDKVGMIVLPGGMPGTKHLENCAPLMEQVDAFVKADRPVSAICAAPSILGHRGHLKGREACSYPSFEDHLEGAKVLKNPSVVSGNITTGRGMGAAIPFALSIVERYQGKTAADDMAETIVYENDR